MHVVPPAQGIYHAAFAGFCPSESCVGAARIREFERLTGRRIVWAYFSDNWFGGIRFPAARVRSVWSADHTIPFIRLMPRANWKPGCADRTYSLAKIVAGRFDPQLRAWARAAARTRIPLMVEFGTEANGNWFPWSGACNGGPARFRSAYRHVVDVFRAAGATNVTRVLHLDASAGHFAAYYPGARWVDWVGLSAYGAQQPGDPWTSFESVFAPAYRALAKAAPGKPIALLEVGAVAEPGHDLAAWIRNAYHAIESGRFPRLKAESWWSSNWVNTNGEPSIMRVDSSPRVLAAYRAAIASSRLVSRAVFAG